MSKADDMRAKGQRMVSAGDRTTPTQQTKVPSYPARMELTTTYEQLDLLEEARRKDRIRNTARIRAMIALYQQDEELRRRVDQLAKDWR